MENEKIWNTFALIQCRPCRVIIPQVVWPFKSLTCSHTFFYPWKFPAVSALWIAWVLWITGPYSSYRAWPASASGQWKQLLHLSSTTRDSAGSIPVQRTSAGTHWMCVSGYITFKQLPLVFRPAFVYLFKGLYLSDGRTGSPASTSALSKHDPQYKFLLRIMGIRW